MAPPAKGGALRIEEVSDDDDSCPDLCSDSDADSQPATPSHPTCGSSAQTNGAVSDSSLPGLTSGSDSEDDSESEGAPAAATSAAAPAAGAATRQPAQQTPQQQQQQTRASAARPTQAAPQAAPSTAQRPAATPHSNGTTKPANVASAADEDSDSGGSIPSLVGSESEADSEEDSDSDSMPSLASSSQSEAESGDEEEPPAKRAATAARAAAAAPAAAPVGAGGAAESDDDDEPPDLLEQSESEVSESEDEDDGRQESWNPTFNKGFLDKSGKKAAGQPGPSRPGSRAGQAASVAAACAMPARKPAPYQSAPSSSAAPTPPAAAAAAAAPAAQARSPPPKQKKAKTPEPARAQERAPQKAPEVVDAGSFLREERLKREEARRKAGLDAGGASGSAPAAPAVPKIGRCCLNRGIGAELQHCQKDSVGAVVLKGEQHVVIRCSMGCVALMHYPDCWRRFTEAYKAAGLAGVGEGEDLPAAFRASSRLKSKDRLVGCITDNCKGHVLEVKVIEGKGDNDIYMTTAEQREEATRLAAEAADSVKQARRAAAHAAFQAKRQAWLARTGQLEARPPKVQLSNAEHRARRLAKKEGRAAPQIEVKMRSTKPAMARASGDDIDGGFEDSERFESQSMGASTTTSYDRRQAAEEAAAQAAVMRQGTAQHVDPTYQQSIDEYLEQTTTGKGAGKKKKGAKMTLDEFQAVTAAQGTFAGVSSNRFSPSHEPYTSTATSSNRGAVRMSDFPTLDTVAQSTGATGEEPHKDLLADALMALKIGANDHSTSHVLLIECVDMQQFATDDAGVARYFTSEIAKLAKCEVMQWRVFREQGAVAVSVESPDKATLARVHMHDMPVKRKRIKVCHLTGFPDDATLIKANPDYLPASLTALGLGSRSSNTQRHKRKDDDQDRLAEMAQLVLRGTMTHEEVMQALERDSQPQAQQQSQRQRSDAGTSAAASPSTSSRAASEAASAAISGASAAPKQTLKPTALLTKAPVPPPKPPANPPPKPPTPPPPALPAGQPAPPKGLAIKAPPQQQQQQQQRQPPATLQLPQQAPGMAYGPGAAAPYAGAYATSSMAYPTYGAQYPYAVPQTMGITPHLGGLPVMMMVPGQGIVPMQPLVPVSSLMVPQAGYYAAPTGQQLWQQQSQGSSEWQEEQPEEQWPQEGGWDADQEYELNQEEEGQEQQEEEAAEGDGNGCVSAAAAEEADEREQQAVDAAAALAGAPAMGSSYDSSIASSPNRAKLNPGAREFRLQAAAKLAAQASDSNGNAAAPAEGVEEAESTWPTSADAEPVQPAAGASSSGASTAPVAATAAATAEPVASSSKRASNADAPSTEGVADATSSKSAAGEVATVGRAEQGEASSFAGSIVAAAAAAAADAAGPSTSARETGTATAAPAAASDGSPAKRPLLFGSFDGRVDSPAKPVGKHARDAAAAAGASSAPPDRQQQEQQDTANTSAAGTAAPAAGMATTPAMPVPADQLPEQYRFQAVHVVGCTDQLLTDHYRNPAQPSFLLPASSFSDAALICNPERTGLIMYNTSSGNVEGVWEAVSNEGGNVQWITAGAWQAVPASVWSDLLVLAPFKSRYTEAEAKELLLALWRHAEGQQQAAAHAVADAVAQAGAQQHAVAHTAAQAVVGSQGTPSTTPSLSATSSMSDIAGTAPGASVASAAPASEQQAGRLPPWLTAMQQRAAGQGAAAPESPQRQQPQAAGAAAAAPAPAAPRSVAAERTATPAAPAPAAAAAAAPPAQVPAAAARPQTPPAPAAAQPAAPKAGVRLCTVCHKHEFAWLALACQHPGPCAECCPAANQRLLMNPPKYPKCLTCNKPCPQLLRVIRS